MSPGATELTADFYAISQDAAFPGTVTRLTPIRRHRTALALGEARSKGGVTHVIEPIVQLVWSPDSTDAVPNEDSQIVKFDEGNLFDFNRYPGADRHELGRRVNVGLWLDPHTTRRTGRSA